MEAKELVVMAAVPLVGDALNCPVDDTLLLLATTDVVDEVLSANAAARPPFSFLHLKANVAHASE